MKKAYIYVLILFTFVSCEKEDEIIILPDPGPVTKVIADIGTDYRKCVYIDLKNNTQVTRQWKDWDLAFESSDSGAYVWLNTGKFMFAADCGTSDFATADSTGKPWKIDDDALKSDSNAIGKWWENRHVYTIDRGREFFSGINAGGRYKNVRFEQVSPTQYVFSFAAYGSSNVTAYTIDKQSQAGLVYFSFDNNGQIVDMAPGNDWDFVLTRYTHIYYEEPVNSPYRFYLVNGGLSNKWNGVTGVRMLKDSTAGYVPFENLDRDMAMQLPFSEDANTIGFQWKTVDINTSYYTIVPDIYYVIKDKDGFLYKIRFIAFYDEQGTKGVITFQYQRL